jgi:hypothetical protein
MNEQFALGIPGCSQAVAGYESILFQVHLGAKISKQNDCMQYGSDHYAKRYALEQSFS